MSRLPCPYFQVAVTSPGDGSSRSVPELERREASRADGKSDYRMTRSADFSHTVKRGVRASQPEVWRNGTAGNDGQFWHSSGIRDPEGLPVA